MLRLLSIFTLLSSLLPGGIGDDRMSLLIEARGGLLRSGLKNFSEIYGNDDPVKVAALGIGYNSTFFIAKYRLFEARGKSVVTGLDLEGDARWEEELISLGIRSYDGRFFYGELAFVAGAVRETISTSEPDFSALNSTFSSAWSKGVSLAAGLNIPLSELNFSGEVEYVFVPISSPGKSDGDKINIGGPVYTVGLNTVF
jgi:hypothetical protein